MSDVIVLCYHGVSDSWDTSEAVTPHQLERQLTYLKRRGWRAVPFREAVKGPVAPRSIAITFDDALRSVKELAFPIVSRLGMTATVFAPTSYVTTGQLCLWNGLSHWAETPYAHELAPMSWSELGELSDRGWEIGSHTCTHPRLTQLDDDSLAQELEESRASGCRHLGGRFDTIAYPYGDVDERVASFAKRVGYEAGAGLSSHLRLLSPHRYPRTGIYRRDATWRFWLKTTPLIRRVRASRAWSAKGASGPTSLVGLASTQHSACP